MNQARLARLFLYAAGQPGTMQMNPTILAEIERLFPRDENSDEFDYHVGDSQVFCNMEAVYMKLSRRPGAVFAFLDGCISSEQLEAIYGYLTHNLVVPDVTLEQFQGAFPDADVTRESLQNTGRYVNMVRAANGTSFESS
jgi:hypothetical protein